ncbi:hypothetical protein TNCV_4904581 [Trichonephila clavipes]|uniref:Uncharacterized protein n=1 Tax=Trichonephila clavipes TaxID=2585209 RepID=A0A8X6RRP1_TRICX|nr:hypothetical protein TNCV_4904581 [Trichonephila clavipes]
MVFRVPVSLRETSPPIISTVEWSSLGELVCAKHCANWQAKTLTLMTWWGGGEKVTARRDLLKEYTWNGYGVPVFRRENSPSFFGSGVGGSMRDTFSSETVLRAGIGNSHIDRSDKTDERMILSKDVQAAPAAFYPLSRTAMFMVLEALV